MDGNSCTESDGSMSDLHWLSAWRFCSPASFIRRGRYSHSVLSSVKVAPKSESSLTWLSAPQRKQACKQGSREIQKENHHLGLQQNLGVLYFFEA
jgi:hypothetical protein